ncbi:fimbrial protein [Raoultella ornithinolytica]|uniref:fimbrial protein n=1 Tax=Raoultella ornithinolytica TaxID=54291 RepID=UPI0021AFA5F1|nr:fimbrial protein [Raoultella ornithinolytica]MCT4737206.1 fimbrial protein [Raoultella ornithinolytica]
MKLHTIIPGMVAAGIIGFASPADATRAVIEFSASIVKSTCSIESDRLRMDLGNWSADDFETPYTTRLAAAPITLRFQGCLNSLGKGMATLSVVAADRQKAEVNRHDLWGETNSGVGIALFARHGQMTRYHRQTVSLTPDNNTLMLVPFNVGTDTQPRPEMAPVEIEAGLRRYVVRHAIVPGDVKSAFFFTVTYG